MCIETLNTHKNRSVKQMMRESTEIDSNRTKNCVCSNATFDGLGEMHHYAGCVLACAFHSMTKKCASKRDEKLLLVFCHFS